MTDDHLAAACAGMMRSGRSRHLQVSWLLSLIRFQHYRCKPPRGLWAIDPRIGDPYYDGNDPRIPDEIDP